MGGATSIITFVDVPHGIGALDPLVATALPEPNRTDVFKRAGPTVSVTTGGIQSKIQPGVFSVQGTRGEYVCNRRGTCDYGTGKCTCYAGFTSSEGRLLTPPRGGQYSVAGTYGDCGHWTGKPINSCPSAIGEWGNGTNATCSGASYKCSEDFVCNCTGKKASRVVERGSRCCFVQTLHKILYLHAHLPSSLFPQPPPSPPSSAPHPIQATRATLASIRLVPGPGRGSASRRKRWARTGTQRRAHSRVSATERRANARARMSTGCTKA